MKVFDRLAGYFLLFGVISGFILLIATAFTTACSATKILKESTAVTQDTSSTIMETASLVGDENTLGKTDNTTAAGISNRTPFSYAQLRDDAGFSFDVMKMK